jgi:disulfide bond formation protein DsbB
MTNQLNKKFLFSLLIFISFILIFAFVIEYKLGHKACKLCIYERIPYVLSALLILKILLFKKYEKIILLILSFVFVCSVALAFYHFGIEQGFFKESIACITEDTFNALTKEQLLEQLKQNTISCKDVSFKIMGFSLATINVIFSAILSVIFAKLFISYGKN